MGDGGILPEFRSIGLPILLRSVLSAVVLAVVGYGAGELYFGHKFSGPLAVSGFFFGLIVVPRVLPYR